MNDIQDIITKIKAIAETVSGIENIRNEIYFVLDEREIREKMLGTNGRINALGFLQIERITGDEDEGFEPEEIKRRFGFVFYYEVSLPNGTFATVQILTENLCKAFNQNETLNATVQYHNKMKLTNNILGTTTTKRIVHLLFFEMTTTEYYQT